MRDLFQRRLSRACLSAACAGALAMGAGSASAAVIHVAIDTSRFGVPNGYMGYLDMQLSASAGVPLATVTLSNLSGFDAQPYLDAWGVAPVAAGYLFRNDTANDLFQSVHFGDTLSFDLDFSGVADPATSYISRFVVAAYGSDMTTLLGNFDQTTGALLDVSWTPPLNVQGQGRIAVAMYGPAVRLLPEPAGWMLIAAGLVALALPRPRRSRLSRSRTI